MKPSEIRPHTTYIGHGGLLRKIKSIHMNVDGGLAVEWKAVKVSRKTPDVPTWGISPIKDFAKWALTIHETMSDDLRHYESQRASDR